MAQPFTPGAYDQEWQYWDGVKDGELVKHDKDNNPSGTTATLKCAMLGEVTKADLTPSPTGPAVASTDSVMRTWRLLKDDAVPAPGDFIETESKLWYVVRASQLRWGLSSRCIVREG
jgi:hypothetical protein